MKEQDLKREGWVRAFTAEGARLQEAIEFYKEIGYEVKVLAYKDVVWEECGECLLSGDAKVIYIRKVAV